MSILTSRFAIFNSWNFNNVPGLTVYAINPPGQQPRNLDLMAVARRSARKLASAYYQQNTLAIGIYISRDTREHLEQSLDTLYANIQGQEGSMVLPMSGGVRQYTCTYSDRQVNNAVQNTQSPSGNTADITLIFECSDSYGYDTNYTVIQPAANKTASLYTMQYTQGGSAETQMPHTEVKIGSTTGTQPATITIGNTDTGQAVSVSRTWQANDLLAVGLINGVPDVQVNGVSVAFTGAIPEFAPGLARLYYQDTFTTRTVNIFAYVYNRWV